MSSTWDRAYDDISAYLIASGRDDEQELLEAASTVAMFMLVADTVAVPVDDAFALAESAVADTGIGMGPILDCIEAAQCWHCQAGEA